MRRMPLDQLLTPTRRSFLGGTAVGLTGLLAGCSWYDDVDDTGARDDGLPVDSGATGGSDGGPDGGSDSGPGPDGDGGSDSGTGETGGEETTLEDICGDAEASDPSRCVETPDMGEGPFFREDAPARLDLNPLGEDGSDPLVVCGRVLDEDCTPVAGAVIEVWHVAPEGEYDMKTTDYRFRGTLTSADDGSFDFVLVAA